jgi:hypothetical protein
MERLQVVDEVTTEWIFGSPHMLKRPSGRLDERLQPSHIVHGNILPHACSQTHCSWRLLAVLSACSATNSARKPTFSALLVQARYSE